MELTKILGIDFGTKTIGIAISDCEKKFSIPYCEIANDSKTINKIKEIVDDENVDLIVLGYPKTINNYVSERHQLIIDFQKKLEACLKIKIVFQDESYSTSTAFQSLKSYNVKNSKIKKNKDMIAASIILENYLLNR